MFWSYNDKQRAQCFPFVLLFWIRWPLYSPDVFTPRQLFKPVTDMSRPPPFNVFERLNWLPCPGTNLLAVAMLSLALWNRLAVTYKGMPDELTAWLRLKCRSYEKLSPASQMDIMRVTSTRRNYSGVLMNILAWYCLTINFFYMAIAHVGASATTTDYLVANVHMFSHHLSFPGSCIKNNTECHVTA